MIPNTLPEVDVDTVAFYLDDAFDRLLDLNDPLLLSECANSLAALGLDP